MNRTLYAKVIFEGKTPIEFSKAVKDYLSDEFIKRRAVFVDLVNPMYEQWNSKFDELYPGVDGYDERYIRFICEKHQDALWIANSKNIGLNQVLLESKVENDAECSGYVPKIGVSMILVLCEN